MNIKENKTESGIVLPQKSRLQQLIDAVNEAESDFDEAEFIIDTYHFYLQAVQNSDPKAHLFLDKDDWEANGSPIWDENSTFEEWLIATKKEIIENRLPEIKKKKEEFSADVLSPFQKSIEGFISELKTEDGSEEQKMDKVLYDYYEWHLNKQKETIDNFIAGKVKVLEKDILDNEINNEIGKIANKIVSKKISGFNKKSNIIQ